MKTDRLRKILNESYSKNSYFKLFKRYFLDWIAEGYIGKNLNLFELSIVSGNTDKNFFID